jgi:HPt (histidine-containing phosphotransfer) domain-containing protein
MARLMDFSDGNLDTLRELVTLYLTQTSEQLKQLAAAVSSGDAKEIRRLSHSCAGASATCGMIRLTPLLRQIERFADDGNLADVPRLTIEVQREFVCIREFLAPHCEPGAPTPSAPQPES